MKIFISDYSYTTHILSNNDQIEQSKYFLQIMIKYNISYSTTKNNSQKYKPSESHMQIYKKVINTILDHTGDSI